VKWLILIYRRVWGILHGVEYLMCPGVSERYTAAIFRVTEFLSGWCWSDWCEKMWLYKWIH